MLALLLLIAAPELEYSPVVLRDFRWQTQLQQTPSAWSVENLLEMGGTPVVMSNIESGGFSKVDPLRVSVLGDSYLWSRHTLAGIDVSDPLHAGAQALRVPFRLLDSAAVRFSENAGADMGGVALELQSPHAQSGTEVGGLYTTPTLGGLAPGAIYLMDTLSGLHALQRMPLPALTRRHFDDNWSLSFARTEDLGAKGALRYGAQIDLGTRRFNAFDTSGPAGTFAEPFAIASFAMRYEPRSQTWHAFVAAEYRERKHLFAEQWWSQDESPAVQSAALSVGAVLKDFRAGITFKYEHSNAAGLTTPRELFDLDGQGLAPYYPRGDRIGVNVDLRFDRSIGFSRVFAAVNERIIGFAPSVRAWTNDQLFEGQPIGRIDFRSSPTLILHGHVSAGLRDDRQLGPVRLAYAFYGLATHAGNARLANALALADIGIKAQASLTAWKYLMPFVSLSRSPVPLSANVALALTPGYEDGAVFAGDTLIDTTGGAAMSVSQGLIMAKVHSLAFGFESQLLPPLRVSVQAIGKTFDDTYWTRFASETPVERDDDRYFLTPGEKRYTLDNFPFGERPFFVGGQAQIVAQDPKRYLVSVGFATMFSLGTTAFGNGPFSNDIAVVDPSTANPNARLHRVGNMENDRAYFLKAAFGVRIVDTLWAFASVRYKDGKPFAFYSQRVKDGQLSQIYESPKGSLYKLEGPREDAHVDIDVKVGYTIPLGHGRGLRLEALITNVYDVGSEIAERQGQGTTRASLEMAIPRTGFLTAELVLP